MAGRRRKPPKPSPAQMALGALSKALPTGTTDSKRRRGKPQSKSHKGRNGVMLLAAGAAAAFAKKKRDGKQHQDVVVTDETATTTARPATTAPPVAHP